MDKFAEEVREDVMTAIDKFCDTSLALTTDLWTSKAMDSYISVTIHFIDTQKTEIIYYHQLMIKLKQ